MANIIKLKRSSVVGKVPDAGNIEVGEPTVNLADRILYTKDTGGNVIVIGSGTTSNVIEGTNLYFTNARSIAALSAGQNITIDANGRINSTATGGGGGAVSSVNGQTGNVLLTTANVAESGNLYFTNSRVYSNVTQIGYITSSSLSGYATNSQLALYATNAQLSSYALTTSLTTANVTELTNLYFTNARVFSNVISIGYATNTNVALKANITDLTTANVSELTNLYFTNSRSRQALSSGTGVSYDSSTGTISIGQNVSTTSSVTFGNVIVTGNLLVQGNAITFESNTLLVNDPLIQVGVNNNFSDVLDLGFFGHYYGGTPATERHAGLFRDASDGQFKLFANLDPTPNNIVDTANTSYESANLVVNFVVGKVTNISNHSTTNLSEGNNLYYTNARVYSNVTQLGYLTSSSLTGYATNSQLALYATNSQLSSYALTTSLTTANVSELTNLYFTNARSYANTLVAIKTGNGIIYSNATGNITLSTTGVTANTYGGAAVQTTITVDAYGRITSASNVSATVANTAISGNIISSQITSVANSQITGNTISSKLEPTGVTAATYGNATIIPVVVIDQQGRITSASNVVATISTVANTAITGNIISSQITSVANSQITGNTISSKLEPTGVTAATYGNATIIPVVTIDQQGRITSASNALLAAYATNSQLSVYATNSQLSSYALTTSLTTANVTEVTNLYFTNARSYANTLTAIKTGNGIIYSNTTGNITLSATGVTATTYGNATIVPIITVDAHGRITSVSNVNISGVSSGGSTGTSNAISATQTIFANAGTTTYALTSYPSTSNTLIFIDGLLQFPTTDYSFSSNNLVLTSTPQTGETIYVVTLYPASSGSGSTSSTDTATVKKLQYGLNILLGR